jgi:NO-binding membrane sensor protein with MHYT domain
MTTSQGLPRVDAPLWVSFRPRLVALAALIAVVAAVLALSLSSSGGGSSGVQIDHSVTPKTVAPAPHHLVGGRF